MNNDQPWTLLQGDAAEQMAKLDAGSVDLIVTDPPYFRVKNEPWDRAWNDRDAFLAWLGEVADEWRRVLKPNGSLYCFASPQMAARVQVEVIAPRFDVLAEVVWVKDAGWHRKANRAAARNWHPQTERLVFAQQLFDDPSRAVDNDRARREHALAAEVYAPLIDYLISERDRAGLTNRQIDQHLGTVGMAKHYFCRSQWSLPTLEAYGKLRDLFNQQEPGDYLRREWDDLRREWDDLRREWDDLRREFEELRRPFSLDDDAPHSTDVWTFPVIRGNSKHVCEKPVDLLRHVIRVSSRPGAVVLDSFAGSASTGEAALLEGRHFIGIDADAGWVKKGQQRLAAVTSQSQQPTLWNAS